MNQSHFGKFRAVEIRELGLNRREVRTDFWLKRWSQGPNQAVKMQRFKVRTHSANFSCFKVNTLDSNLGSKSNS